MSPVFGRIGLPVRFRIGLALLLTYILVKAVPLETVSDNVYIYLMLCVKEFLLGVTMGYLTSLFLSVAFTAGQIIDFQIGFGMVNIFDVQNQQQVPLAGNLLNLAALMLFFAADGHLDLIRILSATVYKMPPGQLVVPQTLGAAMAGYFASMFVFAVRLALPVIAASLMAEVGLAVIMRSVPQVNVFILGFPLKILLGLVVLAVILPAYGRFMDGVYDHMYDAIENTFSSWAVA